MLYFALAIASIIYCTVKLTRPGISSESRKVVFIRHVLSLVGFTVSQLYFLTVLIDFFQIVPPADLVRVSLLLFAGSGIFMPFVRLSEPFFY